MALLKQTIENKYLSKIKTIKASTSYELNIKIKEQKAKWKLEEEKQRERERLTHLEQKAHMQNEELSRLLSSYEQILADAINASNSFNWDSLLDTLPFPPFTFSEPEPSKELFIEQFNVPSESFWEVIFPWLRNKRLSLITKSNDAYNAACYSYEEAKSIALTHYNKKKKHFTQNSRLKMLLLSN